MVMLNKTVTVTGACVMNDGEKEIQVAYMTANIPADGKVNINRMIQDKEMFETNRQEVLKDFAAFDEYVYNCQPPDTGAKENGEDNCPDNKE